MKSSSKLSGLGVIGDAPHWSFLIVLFWVALTSLAAGAALALAVNAAFFILAVFVVVNLALMAAFMLADRRRESRLKTAPAEGGTGFKSAAETKPEENRASFVALRADARADEMSRELFAKQSYFPVTQGREVVGVVSKGRLLSALANGHGDRLIAELMNHSGSARPAPAGLQATPWTALSAGASPSTFATGFPQGCSTRFGAV